MKQGKQKLPRFPSLQIEIKESFVTIPKEEDDERIRRLARKIINILASHGKGKANSSGDLDSLFNADFEESIGI